jgi:phosphoribosyl 1,2-cyclic phosphate phosphodiesterase
MGRPAARRTIRRAQPGRANSFDYPIFVLHRSILSKVIVTSDLRGQMVFLGTGTSIGVPVIGCGCPTCTSTNPRNNRLRCAVVLGLCEGNLLIDTPPDLRTQLLREKIGIVHATVFTHDHADHVFGLDDLRLFPYYLKHAMPVYCEDQVEARIRKSFDYAFAEEAARYGGGVPQIEFRRITTEPFEVLSQPMIPIRLAHGKFRVLGFRFGNVAYCTDTNDIPAESWPLLAGLDVLVLDALRQKPHPTHFSLAEAVDTAARIGAKQTFFTHMSHDLEHEATNASLPAGMQLAYDGLRIELS